MLLPKPFRYAVPFLAVILAAGAASSSLSNVLVNRLPEQAVSLPLANRNAFARIGTTDLAAVQAAGRRDPRRGLAENARRAFLAEPTNSVAVSLLALDAQFSNEADEARSLYESALKVSERDRIANLWLIEDASQSGQIGLILDRYDVLLRTGGAASTTLFGVLGAALKDERIVPYLQRRLTTSPPWAEEFWLRVTPNPLAIRNLARLRLALMDQGIANAADNDGEIVRRLAQAEEFDLAFRLYSRLRNSSGSTANVLGNGDFAQDEPIRPFEWETFAAARYGAEIDPVANELVFFVEDPSDVLLARELVVLPPGRYRASIDIRNPEAADSIDLSLATRCAEANSTAAGQSVRLDPRAPITFLMTNGCRFKWIELYGARTDGPGQAISEDVLVNHIRLQRLPIS